MSLQYGLLGLLTYKESTGYDLTRMFKDSLNNFWHAQSSQIYRELNRMEESGWVISRSIIQDKRPNKRLYSITDIGRNELVKWFNDSKIEPENQHSVVLMRIFFGADNPSVTLSLLKEIQTSCKRSLEAHCEPILKIIDNYAVAVPNGQEKSKYWKMTLDYGRRQAQATVEWAENCIKELEKEEVK